MTYRELFPPLEPYLTGRLQVSALHNLYWEECGNPDGIPVVFLHGGPGVGISSIHRRFFDPEVWRIILFDQRGAGQSTPFAETRENTTELLIADLETLRQERGINRWHVFGGSWGSTLALAYAQTHPQQILSLTLRGIFLFRQIELDWFFYGTRTVYPEAWERFVRFIAPGKQHDLLSAYYEILTGDDETLCQQAAQHWLQYETCCATLQHNGERQQKVPDDPCPSALPILEAHYFKNNRFQPDDLLLRNIDKIRHIPTSIVQGRYDMICPIITADELHKHWPEAEYRVIPYAGHSALEPGIRSALIEATEKFKEIKP